MRKSLCNFLCLTSLLIVIAMTLLSVKGSEELKIKSQQVESFTEVVSARFHYRNDIEGWEDYIENYKEVSKTLFEGSEFEESIMSLSKVDSYDGEYLVFNQIQSDLMDSLMVDIEAIKFKKTLARLALTFSVLVNGICLIKR